MKIENQTTREQWDSVVLHLTQGEARELRDSLNALLEKPDRARHEHISNEDFTREITVLLSDL